jgi:hypothetical protein
LNEETEQPTPRQTAIHNASNVIVGDHGTQISHHWHDAKVRRWLIAIVGLLVVALVVFGWIFWPQDPHPRMELAGLAVTDPSKLDADESFPAVPSRPTSIDVTPVDITLKNNGDAPAVIVSAEVEFLYIEMLPNCTGAGPGFVSGNYNIKFPLFAKLPARPFTLKRDMRFIVEAGKVDRFTLTLGPENQSIVSTLLVGAHINLVFDDSSRMDLGNVSFLTTAGSGAERFKLGPRVDDTGRKCQQRNAQILDKLYQIPATRSAEIEQLHHDYPVAK